MVEEVAGSDGDVGRLRLLASAIAGRPLDVAPVDTGHSPWTDGSVVFVDGTAARPDQVRAVAVQASLLAAGSLGPHILGELGRRSTVTRRYLSIEGHRALAASDVVLPWAAR